MDNSTIRDVFEQFFEKYKKTEGDRTSWSAVWGEPMPSGAYVEINLTKCPKGTTFKFFRDKKKLGELLGWDDFFEKAPELLGQDYDPDHFFGSMRDMM
ncbi:hypothetical protein [Desulfovibrio inopinatus]|uniref:hypothetical protein n=1 Tax=Desulfovibrio inopinatus TaxID=102109 RepID=UPI0003FA5D23|nr:hypothetical protein [Desulfovibrio inopinatus]